LLSAFASTSAPPSRKAFPILNNPSTAESTNSSIPTAAQLAEIRLKQWHQQGEALLTIENLRSWINTAGLVLFAPRPQIASPAPSLVEAVLGSPNPNPALEQTSEARSLLARLVAEGLAVPLNLLGPGVGTVHAGAPGDTPDFVASAAVFSYVFTLRGDKAWKQPPTTTGALKISNLALATFEALSKRGALSAYDLTTELGKEVTEAAVLRALGELWTHLRVLPLAQPDGTSTLWELASARFTKQIKAGANAGQPSALSALISLYLGQAVVAAEDEIESFLSPLAPRSRIRDVVHALLSARQLDTVAVEGRTMVHVSGELPVFLAPAQAEPLAPAAGEQIAVEGDAAGPQEADGDAASRITKFVAKPRKIGTGYLSKAKPSTFAAKAFAAKPFASKPGIKARGDALPASNRERRPFSKTASAGATSPAFDKPWAEEKTRRLAAARRPSDVTDLAASASSADAQESIEPRAPRVYKPVAEGSKPRSAGFKSRAEGFKPRADGFKPRGDGFKPRAEGFRPGSESAGDRRAPGGKPAFGGKPAYGGKSSFRSQGRPPRRDFAPRAEGEEARTPRKTFSKPGTFGRKRDGVAARPDREGEARPARRESSPRPGQRPERGERPAFGGPRVPGSYAPRPRAGQPRDDGPRGDRPARTQGGSFAPRKPYATRSSEGAKRSSFFAGERTDKDRGSAAESGKRIYRKFDAPKFDRLKSGAPRDRPARPFSSDRPARGEGSSSAPRKPAGDFAKRKFTGKLSGKPGGSAGKSGGSTGSFAGKKSYGRSGASSSGKPASTFAKFADGKKPFGKRPPARKPRQGDSA
jgi:23S rRNA pseudouridine2605 synthase